jgi:FtsP/CotA-like multicopper oxidase with cupredoxin domain
LTAPKGRRVVAASTVNLSATHASRRPGDRCRPALQRLSNTLVRVNPNEIVELAVRFETYSGRYMYHCHILEHEDRDMMRPIVIMPAQLLPFMT